jgi:hypothetical protein
MASTSHIEWSGIVADPRFQALHRKKQSFLTGLMVFSVAYYFLLPIGAAYFPALFRVGDRFLLLEARQQRVRRDGARARARVRAEGGLR